MDYPNRRRIKIWGHARVVDDPDVMEQMRDSDYRGLPEQAIIFDITAWDINCPQHITPRYTEADVAEVVEPLQQRIAQLEQQLSDKQGTAS